MIFQVGRSMSWCNKTHSIRLKLITFVCLVDRGPRCSRYAHRWVLFKSSCEIMFLNLVFGRWYGVVSLYFRISKTYLWNCCTRVSCRIKGTTGVEILSGLHGYLKYYFGAHMSWRKTGGAQLSSVPKPGSLPGIQDSEITIKRLSEWCFF